MPLYDYLCKNCKHRFEIIQKFSDPYVTTCPKCEEENVVEQVLSAPAVQFKGSGFYVTDYKKKSRQESSGSSDSGSDSKSDSGSKSESKSESKSDSGTNSKSNTNSSSNSFPSGPKNSDK